MSHTKSIETVTCKTHSQAQLVDGALPKGLIGLKCTATVITEGVQCDSLLDSGSQVSTVSKSFHENYFSHQPIFPIQDLLDIDGAGGQEVPYLGYVQVDVDFPEDIMGKSEKILTLALVVPDHKTNVDVPLLIGTNTLDPLYEKCTLVQGESVKCRTKDSNGSPLLKHPYHQF